MKKLLQRIKETRCQCHKKRVTDLIQEIEKCGRKQTSIYAISQSVLYLIEEERKHNTLTKRAKRFIHNLK